MNMDWKYRNVSITKSILPMRSHFISSIRVVSSFSFSFLLFPPFYSALNDDAEKCRNERTRELRKETRALSFFLFFLSFPLSLLVSSFSSSRFLARPRVPTNDRVEACAYLCVYVYQRSNNLREQKKKKKRKSRSRSASRCISGILLHSLPLPKNGFHRRMQHTTGADVDPIRSGNRLFRRRGRFHSSETNKPISAECFCKIRIKPISRWNGDKGTHRETQRFAFHFGWTIDRLRTPPL